MNDCLNWQKILCTVLFVTKVCGCPIYSYSESDVHYDGNGRSKLHVELRCEAWSLHTGTTANVWYCDR
jgi:hypothetical protein